MNCAASRNSFTYLGSRRTFSPACSGSTPMLKEALCPLVSAVSSGHTHSACLVPGPSGGLWQSHTSGTETPACVQSSGILIPQCPWPCAEWCGERTDVCGLCCLAKRWAGRNGWTPSRPGSKVKDKTRIPVRAVVFSLLDTVSGTVTTRCSGWQLSIKTSDGDICLSWSTRARDSEVSRGLQPGSGV